MLGLAVASLMLARFTPAREFALPLSVGLSDPEVHDKAALIRVRESNEFTMIFLGIDNDDLTGD